MEHIYQCKNRDKTERHIYEAPHNCFLTFAKYQNRGCTYQVLCSATYPQNKKKPLFGMARPVVAQNWHRVDGMVYFALKKSYLVEVHDIGKYTPIGGLPIH